jgi:hypothetical protein
LTSKSSKSEEEEEEEEEGASNKAKHTYPAGRHQPSTVRT